MGILVHASLVQRLRSSPGFFAQALLHLGLVLSAISVRGSGLSLHAPPGLFELLYMEPVTAWPDFRRGSAEIVRPGNRWTLVGSGSRGFHVLDLTDPSQPIRVGSTAVGNLYVSDLWSTNDLAFVADSSGVRAYDLSVPSVPYVLGNYPIRQLSPVLLGIGDGTLCTLSDGAVEIVGFADPTKMNLRAYSPRVGGNYLAVDGNFIFVTTTANRQANAKLLVFEFSPPRQLEQRGELTLGAVADEQVGAIRFDSGRIYARLDRFTALFKYVSRLAIADVQDPRHPVLLGAVEDSPRGSFAIAGSTGALADPDRGLVLTDVSASDHWVPLATLPSRDRTLDVRLGSNLGLVADSQAGLQILDLHQPALPVRQASVDLGGFTSDLLRVSNALYVADGGGGLRIFDVSTPTNPIPLQRVYLQGRVAKLQRSGATLSVLTGPAPGDFADYTNNALTLLDIREPFFPRVRSKLEFGAALRGQRALGNFIYLAEDSAGIIVLDAQDAEHPAEVGRQDTFGEANALDVVAGRAYVADGSQGLQIFDVSDPRKIRRLGGYKTADPAREVHVAGHHAFVLDRQGDFSSSSGSFTIFDVSDAAHPVVVARTPGRFLGCTLAGDLAFLGFGHGLALYNISRITDPKYLGSAYFATDDAASVVNVNGRAVNLAMGDAGIRTFQLKGRTEQRLRLDLPGIVSLGRGPIAVNASSSSGLPVSVAVIDGPARVDDSQLVVTNYGSVTLRAEQPGNDDYFGTSLDVTVQVRVPIRFVLSQGGLDLYWPAAATGLRLQRTPALDPEAHWVNLEAPVAVAGEEFRVHLSPQATSELFRLSR